MNRSLRKFGLFVGLLVVVSIIWFPFELFYDDITDALKARAERHHIFVDIGSVEMSFPANIYLSEVGGVIRRGDLPVPFAFERVALHPQLLPFLTLKSVMKAELAAYDGRASTRIERKFFDDLTHIELQAHSLNRAKHPALGFYGVRGLLSLEGEASVIAGEPFPRRAFVDISLSEGHFQGDLSPLVPEIKNIEGEAFFTQEQDQASLEKLSLSSSVGTATGTGRIALLPTGLIKEASFQFRIQLSDAGRKSLGGYIALLAQGNVDNPGANWELSITQSPRTGLVVNSRELP